MGVPFQRGDLIHLAARSSVARPFDLFVNIRRESGKVDSYRTGVLTPTADRVSTPIDGGPLGAPGTIEGFTVTRKDSTVTLPKRGQTWVHVQLSRRGVPIQMLGSGYWTDTFTPSLGVIGESGPAGGEGFVSWFEVANDIAPASIVQALAATNAYRKVYGFVWYYHSSGDTATRTMRAGLRDVGLAQPTGMTQGDKTRSWVNEAVISLTANEEGLMYVMAPGAREGYQVVLDDGAATIANTASEPMPFPLLVPEDDAADLLFTLSSPHANDRHSIYILMEEWIVP